MDPRLPYLPWFRAAVDAIWALTTAVDLTATRTALRAAVHERELLTERLDRAGVELSSVREEGSRLWADRRTQGDRMVRMGQALDKAIAERDRALARIADLEQRLAERIDPAQVTGYIINIPYTGNAGGGGPIFAPDEVTVVLAGREDAGEANDDG